MNIDLTEGDIAFQNEVRSFLTTEYPDDIRRKRNESVSLTRDDMIRWQKLLYKKGWFAVDWPVEYGGTGWSPVQKYLFARELAAINAPYIVSFGVKMVAPIIYTYGNEEQKQRFLPDILSSDAWWCQGYSEPGSGSDLASLRTNAVRDDDHYVINGTKTWTTLGQHADWIFCLVRTSTDVARRQEGISFLLIDMKTKGVTVRPIITIEGGHEVNEIHFENVRVPVGNLVGEEGKGWTYGKVLLQHERTNIAGVHASQYRIDRLRERAQQSVYGEPPLADDKNFMRKLAAVQIELKALEFTELRVLASVAVGKAPGPESSLLKIRGTEVQQTIDVLMMEAAGYYALPYVPAQYDLDFDDDDRIGSGSETATSLQYFNNRKASIYGGSNEIQKNIISKHVLGL
ncbi:MAG: acyl-CoA dehydrogenase family protein [Pseudomonadota bacterium]|nr:acyl-CoA dehydrogenase family protein [Pseudomonadota bacterium]